MRFTCVPIHAVTPYRQDPLFFCFEKPKNESNIINKEEPEVFTKGIRSPGRWTKVVAFDVNYFDY